MSASQRTTNMQLPLFVDSDKFERTDWNSAMNAIDGAVGSNVRRVEVHQILSTAGNTIGEQVTNMWQQVKSMFSTFKNTYGGNCVIQDLWIHAGHSWGYLHCVDPCLDYIPNLSSNVNSLAFTGISDGATQTLHISNDVCDNYLIDYHGTAIQYKDNTLAGQRGLRVKFVAYR